MKIIQFVQWGIVIDVEITPIYCLNCQKQLDGFFVIDGSRYGQVGAVVCEHCGAEIPCNDDDINVYRLLTYNKEKYVPSKADDSEGKLVLNYENLYKLDKQIWISLKEKIGYDIIERHMSSTISLKDVIDEICKEYKVELSEAKGNKTLIDTRIKTLPIIINKWFSLLSSLNIDVK